MVKNGILLFFLVLLILGAGCTTVPPNPEVEVRITNVTVTPLWFTLNRTDLYTVTYEVTNTDDHVIDLVQVNITKSAGKEFEEERDTFLNLPPETTVRKVWVFTGSCCRAYSFTVRQDPYYKFFWMK